MECSGLTKLKLTTRERLRRKTVSDKVTRYDGARQAAIAALQGRVEYYKGLQARVDRRD